MCLEILGLCELTFLNEQLLLNTCNNNHFLNECSQAELVQRVGISSTGYKAVTFLFCLCLQKMSYADPELENNRQIWYSEYSVCVRHCVQLLTCVISLRLHNKLKIYNSYYYFIDEETEVQT